MGDNNHSESLADIAMHYAILNVVQTINQTEVYAGNTFIDDIICISLRKKRTVRIKINITEAYQKVRLNVKFRGCKITAHAKESVEYLDVLHITCREPPFGFVTKTAKDRCFSNGLSHHPTHIFKSNVFSEAIRTRRLCERDADFKNSLSTLQTKCLQSNFPKKITYDFITYGPGWTKCFGHKGQNQNKPVKRRVVWATPFPTLSVSPSDKEKYNPMHRLFINDLPL